MDYRYITEDNLESCQSYMYTQYGGYSFLKAYYETREPFLVEETDDLMGLLQAALQESDGLRTSTFSQLFELLRQFDQVQVDLFLKRFEVSKRLFSEYDFETGKAVHSSGYRDIRLYVMLSALVERSYSESGLLKYLNCLLKLNDTLLSLAFDMNICLLEPVKMLITREVKHITELAIKKNISLKGE